MLFISFNFNTDIRSSVARNMLVSAQIPDTSGPSITEMNLKRQARREGGTVCSRSLLSDEVNMVKCAFSIEFNSNISVPGSPPDCDGSG